MKNWVKLFAMTTCIGAISSAEATTIIPKSENQMIIDAVAICAFDVLELKTENISSNIITKAKVKPIECFKGELSGSVYVKWPGGTYKKNGKLYHTVVPGTPNLQKNRPVILYLWRSSPSDDFTILSWIHGVVRLDRTEANELVIPRSSSPSQKLSATPPKSKSSPSVAGLSKAAPTKKMTYDKLSDFREKVKRVLSSAESRK